MSEIDVRLRPRPRGWARLPVLDPAQAAVVEAARHRDVIARGAPSSGRTTVALAVLAEAVSGGRSAVLLVPDRARADHLAPRAQVLAPNAVRPVRTPASFAYQVVSTWRTQRRSPLGPVELVTGSAQDQAIARLIESVPAPWPDQIPAQMRAMPAFRAELRNLFARAGEAGMDGDALIAAGERFGQGQWVAAGHLLRELLDASVTGAECPGALRVDLSRIQALAADLVGSWERDGAAAGVSAPPPVPDVVVVDDLQDCTPSTITLLGACSAAGARVVALSDSDVAVAGYRGGEPHLDLRLASLLGAGIDELDRVHGPSPRIRALVAEAASRVTQSGPSARRRAGADGDDAERPLRTHLAATPAQMGALIARELRAHRLHDAVAWSGQVVIVRSASMVDEMRRHLSRGGVPVAGGGRAFDFASQPVTRLMLDLLVAPRGGSTAEAAARAGLAKRLLASALVGADMLAVHRLLRGLAEQRPGGAGAGGRAPGATEEPTAAEGTAGEPADSTGAATEGGPADAGPGDSAAYDGRRGAVAEAGVGEPAPPRPCGPPDTADLVADPALWGAPLREEADRKGRRATAAAELAGALGRAGDVWEAAATGAERRPQEALWAMWSAAGVADQWRSRAMADDAESGWYDDQLDAVVALMRVADVWEQRNPGGAAGRFAEELLGGSVPIDTISRVGQRPEGVEVLTPAQAVGRHWEVVAVVGLQDGAWPNMRLRDRILRADLLADVGAGRTATDPEGNEALIDSTRAARKSVLDEEYRLLVAALSRATRFIHAGAVRNEHQAPSAFFDLVATHAGTPRTGGVVPLDEVPAPLSLSGHIAALRQDAAREDGSERAASAVRLLALLAREGVRAAHPDRWMGAGGTPTTDAALTGEVVLSPSQFESALQCPLRWFLTTIGADGPGTAAQSLGTLVHDIAERHPNGTREQLRAALDERIGELGYDLGTWAGRRDHAHAYAVIDNLASYMEGVPGAVDVEGTVAANVEGVTIRGRMDRVEHVDGGVRVTDIKTGRYGYTAKSVPDNPQLAAYQMALLALGQPVVGGRIALVGGDKERVFDQPALHGEALDEWRAAVRRVGEAARGPSFRATPSEAACRFCSFDRLCPARDRGRKTVD